MRHLVREHIKNLIPYSSARAEFEGQADIMLDANENPHSFQFNRYPDPYQWDLKKEIAKIKAVDAENIFLGNGSDEIIDLLVRSYCEPTIDSIYTIEPSFSMYEFSANLNQVDIRKFQLNADFSLNVALFIEGIKQTDKIIFICSPNNPTGNTFSLEDINQILNYAPGLVVIDEAYIDFSDSDSALTIDHPHLVVLQTFSKSYGAAGIRLGMAFMHVEMVSILNAVKSPYNVSEITQQFAINQLRNISEVNHSIAEIKEERKELLTRLNQIESIIKVYPSEANFFLVKCKDSDTTYKHLLENNVIVRDRSKVVLCDNCLRITIGTQEENERLISLLKSLAQ